MIHFTLQHSNSNKLHCLISCASRSCCLYFPWGRAGGKLKYLWQLQVQQSKARPDLGSECHSHRGDNRWLGRVKQGVILQLGCGQLPGRIQGYSVQTEECRVNWGSAVGTRGRWNLQEEEEEEEKDVLVDTEVRADFPRWSAPFTVELRGGIQPSLAPRPDSTKGSHLGYQRNQDSLEASPGAKLHEPWSYVYQYHDRCLSSPLPLIIVCKGVY